MKKCICIFLALLCCFTIVGCKKYDPPPVNVGPSDPPEQTEGVRWIVAPEKTYADVEVIDVYYDTTNPGSQYLTYKENGKWGIINDKLEVILQPTSESPIFMCTAGHLHVEDYDTYQVITLENGIKIVNGGHGGFSFNVIYNVVDGQIYSVSMTEDGSDVVLLSEYGYTLPDIICFEYASLYYDEMWQSYAYESEYRYGYCDESGNILSPTDYDYAQPFSGGVAAVMQGGKWSYIDTSFDPITNVTYQPCYGSAFYKGEERSPFFAYSMTDGYAPVMQNAKYGVIDQTGAEILPCAYDKILPLTGGRALIRFEGKWGIADLKQ